MTTKPSPSELLDIFEYSPDTGELRWKMKVSRKVIVGSVAGHSCLSEKGRVSIGLYGRNYRAHAIIWAMMTGDWPHNQIDHKDEDPSNNKWNNLREATKSQNMSNISRIRSNTSGYKGVSFHKQRQKWRAHIHINGKSFHLGLFLSAEQAHEAYKSAALSHFGEYAKF